MEMSQNISSTYSRCEKIFRECQNRFKSVYEKYEKAARIVSDPWQVDQSKVLDQGGGSSIVIDGNVLERAACGFSSVGGKMNEKQSMKIFGMESPVNFHATGVSIIVHPKNPHVPSFHANLRYFETESGGWFGGGCDLTPYYLVDGDVRYFHGELRSVCEDYQQGAYNQYKENCDKYFYLPHRKERRGVGGIFFDYLNRNNETDIESVLQFITNLSNKFPEVYDTIISRNIDKQWSEQQREFQLWRRGRYVEFNLLYDRGTAFGLETGGRVESILSSMPPLVKWKYNYQVEPGSEEAKLLAAVSCPS